MTRISVYSALLGADADAAADLIEVVDVSEGEVAAANKKMTLAELFAALGELADDRVAGLLAAGSNVTLTYDDAAGTLTIDAASVTSGGISDFNEAVDDRVAALIQAGAGITKTYNDTAGTLTLQAAASVLDDDVTLAGDSSTAAPTQHAVKTAIDDAVAGALEWAPNFSADGDVYIPAVVAMTIDQGNAAIGAGTITFEASTAADPDTFTAATLPADIEAGAWLKVTAASVTGFCATHLKRTA